MKPGDLVTLRMSDDAQEDGYYPLLDRTSGGLNGGVFGVDDVGLVLEKKNDRVTFYRVMTTRGNGWIGEWRLQPIYPNTTGIDLIKRVTRETW